MSATEEQKITTAIPNRTMLKGIAVSRGISQGSAYVIGDSRPMAVPRRTIGEAEIISELARFEVALNEAEGCLRSIQKEIKEKAGSDEAAIFEAQILLLSDPSFVKEVRQQCSTRKINIEAAVSDAIEKFSVTLAALRDPYMRERAADVRDVGRRLLERLLMRQCQQCRDLPNGAIIVTDELFPSSTARLNFKAVRGVVTQRGGRTSHASILTRSLGIPSVIGISDAAQHIKNGDTLIVDGLAGMVHVNPPANVRREYDRLEADFAAYRRSLQQVLDFPAVTEDGTPVKLSANIGKIADAEAAGLFKADGIGLYRTEFSFLIRARFPTEEEQYQTYKEVAERMQGQPVVIRALDLGSDKVLPYFPQPAEANPALGRRGMRLLLKHSDLLKTQIAAILRLSATHPVSLLLPMVTGIEDIMLAKAIIKETKSRLRRDGEHFNPNLPVGVMIETPAAALLAEQLAAEVDFFSVGTNDLIQYLLCADRTSPEMTAYSEPLHPAVLRTLKTVVDVARASRKELSVCGEMAGNAAYTELLLGLGVRSFSVTPGEILEIKKSVRSVRMSSAERLAGQLMKLATVQQIKACIANFHVTGSEAATGGRTDVRLPGRGDR